MNHNRLNEARCGRLRVPTRVGFLGLLGAAAGLILFSACGKGGPPTDLPPDEGVLGVSEYAPTSDRSVSSDALVAAYDMTTLTGNGRLRDFSERGLHGLIEGTKVAEAPRGGGREFEKASDRIALPASSDFDLNGPLSIVARFRYDLEGQHQHIIACDDKFVLWLTENDRPRFANTLGDAIEGDARLSSGEWHVVIGIFRGTAGDGLSDANIELWIDGVRVPVGFRSSTGGPPFVWHEGTLRETNACFIGFESHAGEPQHQNLPFFGVIDEIMLFERALSTQEVAALSVSP
ncbi:MAG TPA: LamG-like jellyroll fold domain-containing protein [Longimicrobiales bacterium]|nr:LamG-like jellyroll fold domain-containing protein [Longimicrobiales bacterium]